MKKNSQLKLLVCLLLLQPSLHAHPFQTAAAHIAAVMYWTFMGVPTIALTMGTAERSTRRNELKKLDDHGNPLFPDLKNYDPTKYAEAKALLQRDGLVNIDDYSIKVITDAGLEKEPGWKDVFDSPCSLDDKVIVFPDVTNPENGSPSALSNLDSASVAAVLRHEMQHDIQNHYLKNVTIRALSPLVLHALTQLATTPHSDTPTIGLSSLRIVQGYAILMASKFVGHYWSRQSERDADAALKNSPSLARALASYLKREFHGMEKEYEDECKKQWNSVHQDNKNIGILPTLIAKTMNQSQYVELQKSYRILDLPHPWPSERIAYLEKWADEAEGMKKN